MIRSACLRFRAVAVGAALAVASAVASAASERPAQGLAPHAPKHGADIGALIARHGLEGARVGFHVIDQENGGLISSRDADQFFIPASTAKIVTAAGALGVLGPRHRFRTSVHAVGRLRDGVLDGDLYLKGSGDPLLSVQDLLAMIERLRDLGLGRVAGRFIYDETALPVVAEIDPAQPAAAPYNAGLSALTLDFNRIRVHWRRGADGPVTAVLSPAAGAGGIVISDADPGPGRAFVPAPGQLGERWALAPHRLSAPAGVTELPVRDPGRRAAMVFRALAAGTGTALARPEAGALPAEARELTAVESPPLARLLRPALAHSNNVVSELIGMAAARKLAGKPASLSESSRTLIGWLGGRALDLDTRGLELPNHSGLSAQARATPKQMLALRRHALLMRYDSDGIVPLLPAAGWRESFGGRFRDPATAGWVWGKTGTMHYATGIVGVLFGQASGRRSVFALYVMDDEKRRAFDADPAREGAEALARAEDWIQRAKALEEDLVSGWVRRY